MHIPLPPLAEQRRVVARIEGLACKVAAAEKLRRESAVAVEAAVAAEEQRLWASVTTVRPLAEVTSFLARGRQAQQGESDHYLIKSQHVQLGRYVPTALRLAEHAAARVREEALAREGDVLIACSAAGCLGRVALYSEPGKVASTDTHVAIARPDPSAIDPSYLYAFLRSAPGQIELRRRERGDWEREKVGFRLTELNVRDLRSVPVPVPLPGEQRRIVERVSSLRSRLDAVAQLQAEAAAEESSLMPAALGRAF